MSYSVRAADNLMAEQQYEIERQHGEITELKSQLVEARNETHRWMDANGRANTAAYAAEDKLRRVQEDAEEFGKLADRLSAVITSAVSDLRLLTEVPFGQLEDAIKAVADRLADQNGEAY